MNSFVENLNQWGGSFLSFAWPMLWQSSLLIVVLFAFDLMLRRRLRASIRYALWLVVLIKLCVPPTLALPTSPAWWLHKAPPPIVAKPARHYTVTYDDDPLPEMPLTPLPAFVPPPPAMTSAAWLLAVSAAVSATLLLWLLARWWQITRLVRRAAASERLTTLADAAQQVIGLNLKVRVKLTPNAMSPAVCGLFRPAILIPQSLAANFSDEQLRAVLLHELIHLRRRDVWLNFVQALLQIIYWWHPLVWLANARIRRVREEAVDDAVMLALRDEAEAYAPTLLEVAKLALNRPLVSLGLVGIIESRSALRQRIERLVDFRPPRRAGLTLVSLLGILAFTAVAVPMGDGPIPTAKSNVPETATTEEQSLTVTVNPEIFFRNLKAQSAKAMQLTTNYWGDILMELLRDEGVDCNPPHGLAFTNATGELTTQNTPEQLKIFRRVIEQLNRADGICKLPLGNNPLRKDVLIEGRFYPMSDGEFGKFTTSLHHYSGGSSGEEWWSVPPEQFKQFVNSIEASGLQMIQRPRIQTGSGIATTFYVGNQTNSLELACKPHVGEGFVDLALESTVISGAPVNAFTNHVANKASTEDHGGIVLRMANYGGHAGSNLVVLISAEILTNTARFQERRVAIIKRGPPAKIGEAQNLVQDGKLLYEMGKLDEAEMKLNAALSLDAGNEAAKYYLGLVQSALQRPTINQIKTGQQTILGKLEHIQLDQFGPFMGVSLGEVVRQLNETAKQNDPEKTGVNFLIATNFVSGQPSDISFLADINLASALKNVTVASALEAIVQNASMPLKYSILDNGIVFSLKDPQQLFSRHFKLNTDMFIAALRTQPGIQSNTVSAMAGSFFKMRGVDLEVPGKSIFFNNRLGQLFVRATATDLDKVEEAIEFLNRVAPQIHIKARFLEVPKGTSAGLKNVMAVTNLYAGSNETAGLVGILTDKNFRTVLGNLEARPGVETLAEPEVVTTSGRQTQILATRTVTIITNMAFQENFSHLTTNGVLENVTNAVFPEMSKLECGPILDTVPSVLSDGQTIYLPVTASRLEFLGYADVPTNAALQSVTNSAGEVIQLPNFWPAVEISRASANINMFDGQTLVLKGFKPEQIRFAAPDAKREEIVANWIRAGKKKNQVDGKELIVFVTATIVDPAGNRIHPND